MGVRLESVLRQSNATHGKPIPAVYSPSVRCSSKSDSRLSGFPFHHGRISPGPVSTADLIHRRLHLFPVSCLYAPVLDHDVWRFSPGRIRIIHPLVHLSDLGQTACRTCGITTFTQSVLAPLPHTFVRFRNRTSKTTLKAAVDK